jgi:hypothetical protein
MNKDFKVIKVNILNLERKHIIKPGQNPSQIKNSTEEI